MQNGTGKNCQLYVGLMNDSFAPQIDGVANAVMNYAEIIQRQYGKALVAAPYYPKASDETYPYRVIRYRSIGLPDRIGYRMGNPLDPKALDLISKEPISILHSHCPVTALMLGRTLREALNVPLILTYHTKFDIDIRNAISLKLIQEAAIHALVDNINSCDEVWVVSKGAGENLRSLGYRGDYIVMENGVDVPKGRVSTEAVNSLRTEYKVSSDVPVFLFVGRLMWYKGIRIILESLKNLKTSGIQFRMIFVGGGTDSEEIIRFTAELDLSDRCVFTGPVRDRERLRAFYSMANLFLFPSSFDTNGLVVREAAASGLGSMLIRGSCAAEGVTDGSDGILIDENADSMTRALIGISANRDYMNELGDQAMNSLYCSWDQSVAKAVERYRMILADNRPLKFRKLRPDDYFYRSLGDTYSAIHTIRSYYDAAKEQRDILFEQAGERALAMIDQVLERRESLKDHYRSQRKEIGKKENRSNR